MISKKINKLNFYGILFRSNFVMSNNGVVVKWIYANILI